MPSDVATAYVQIIPSAKGIGSGIAEALGGDKAAASTGENLGKSLGSKLVDTLKGVIAAAGLGAALGKTLTEGGALEQSMGGVETLFKDSANQVIAAADRAFTTAGVSANSYMEQVTSFSATLLQGLGGDTEAAASYADKAIVQMSDNANKMGTDMQAVQNAYQGFAKQNYTMLDNLKLGYGGTQSEMARLINDSGVLGDSIKVTADTVKDVPFNKVIDAIGVIQDELGFTGTTALEASTTLTGSLASMQAAASNVMANLTLGRDLGPALDGLAQTVSTFLTGNLLPAVWNILSSLPESLASFVQTLAPQLVTGIQSLLPQLTAALPQMMQSFVDGFSTFLPQAVDIGTQFVASIGSGLVQGIPDFLSQALPMVLQFADTLRANFSNIVDAGIDLLLNFVQGIANGLPALIEYVPQIVSNIAGLINDNMPKILQAGIQVIVILVKGLIDSIPTIIANMPAIIKAIADTITAFNWLHLGATVIKGIGSGLRSMAGGLKSTMEGTFSGALNFLKSLPGQAIQWAKDMISGFIKGITGSIGGVVNAVKDVASAITSYLHFSKPDIGPLRSYEEWMPDFLSGIASGITQNMYRVTGAMNALGTGMTDELQSTIPNTVRLRSTIAAGTPGTTATRSTSDRDLLNAINTAARAIVQAVQENGGDIVIGDDVIYHSFNRARQSQSIMLGGAY